eukprot:scaffold238063_cov30-Tisochrysis_lutea.AAC.1
MPIVSHPMPQACRLRTQASDNDFRSGPMTQGQRETGLKPYTPGEALVNGRSATSPPPFSLSFPGFSSQQSSLAMTQ